MNCEKFPGFLHPPSPPFSVLVIFNFSKCKYIRIARKYFRNEIFSHPIPAKIGIWRAKSTATGVKCGNSKTLNWPRFSVKRERERIFQFIFLRHSSSNERNLKFHNPTNVINHNENGSLFSITWKNPHRNQVVKKHWKLFTASLVNDGVAPTVSSRAPLPMWWSSRWRKFSITLHPPHKPRVKHSKLREHASS